MKTMKINVSLLLIAWTLFFVAPVYGQAANSFPLTEEESQILLIYFSDTHDKLPIYQQIKFHENINNIFDKITGENDKRKSENELKLYITLIYMADTFNQPSQDNIILDGLYERFKLQPSQYFNALKYYEGKRRAFCYYLGQSYGAYLYVNKIKATDMNQRQLFEKEHLNDMKVLESKKDIEECLGFIPEEMPSFD